MLKLNAGFSRKVGEANYGSRGASVNVELEVESALIGDADALVNRIRTLFTIAKRAVDNELTDGNGNTGRNANAQHNGRPARSDRWSQPGENADDQPPIRLATNSQVRAIRSMCQRQRLDPDRFANEQFGVGGVDELTVLEASSLIDELKNGQASGRNGGGQ